MHPKTPSICLWERPFDVEDSVGRKLTWIGPRSQGELVPDGLMSWNIFWTSFMLSPFPCGGMQCNFLWGISQSIWLFLAHHLDAGEGRWQKKWEGRRSRRLAIKDNARIGSVRKLQERKRCKMRWSGQQSPSVRPNPISWSGLLTTSNRLKAFRKRKKAARKS